jgi:putative flavoprotein involved in K+ transport
MPFRGDPDGYPTRDEVLAYLEEYAETFKLPVRLNTRVRRLSSRDRGFVLELDEGHIVADQVVVATGPFQVPLIPAVAGELSPEVFQVHSTGYMQPSDIPPGTILVVGGGNTGYLRKRAVRRRKTSRCVARTGDVCGMCPRVQRTDNNKVPVCRHFIEAL